MIDLRKIAEQKAQKYGLDPDWLMAQITTESSGDPSAVGPDTKWGNAQGVAQLLPSTAKSLGVSDPFDPEQAIEGQAKLMKENIDRYGTIEDALRAYHGGTDKTNWGPKTEDYVSKVQTAYKGTPVTIPNKEDFDSYFDKKFGLSQIEEPTEFDSYFDKKFGLGQEPTTIVPAEKTQDQIIKAVAKLTMPLGEYLRNRGAVTKGFTQGIGDVGQSVGENIGLYSPEESSQRNKLYGDATRGNPWAEAGRTAGQIAGVLPVAAGGGALLNATSRAVPAIAPSIQFAMGRGGQNALTQLASNVMGGVISGAATTPLISAASDESLLDQTQRNAALGGMLNPALKYGGKLVGSAAGKGKELWDQVTQGTDKVAENKLTQALLRDSIDDPISKFKELGPNATLFDVGGNNTRGLGRAITATPSEGKDLLYSTIKDREAGQNDRVVSLVNKALNPQEQNFYGVMDDLIEARKADASPLAQKAYDAKPFIQSETLDNLIGRPSGKSALTKAYKIAAEEGRDPKALGLAFNDAGDVVFEGKPSMQTYDYVKRGLDDIVESYRDKTTGKLVLDTEGRAINQTRAAFVRELRDINPQYAEYLDSWAGPSQMKDALERGRSMVNWDEEKVASVLKGMSPSEQEFARIGAARKIQDAVRDSADSSDAVKKVLGNFKGKKRAVLEQLWPDKKGFREFEKQMTTEAELFHSGADMTRGSRTTPMKLEQEDAGKNVRDAFDLATDVHFGNWPGVGARVMDYIKSGGMREETANSLARLGIPASQEEGIATLNRLLAGRRNQPLGPSRASKVMQALSSAYGVPATTIGVNRILSSE